MARRKGSGRGKSTVNSRKIALENSRERLKDDLVSARKQQQTSNSDMEATITATATTTTQNQKHYNKIKFQNNQRRNLTSATTTSSSSSTTTTSAISTTTKSGSNNSSNNVASLTIKNKRNNNINNKTNNFVLSLHTKNENDVEAGGSNQIDNTMKSQKQITNKGRASKTNSSTATGVDSPEMNRKEKEQKTATNTTATNKNINNNNNNNKNVSSGQQSNADMANNTNAISTTSSSISSISSSSNVIVNVNNKNSDSSNSLLNKQQLQQQPQQQQQQEQQPQYELSITNSKNTTTSKNNNNSSNIIIDESSKILATIQQNADIEADIWNNSKYLHKKFKRLASTTEIDCNIDELNSEIATKSRKASISSASSSISSPPPPQQQQQQQFPPPNNSTQLSSVGLTNGYHYMQQVDMEREIKTTNASNTSFIDQTATTNVVNTIIGSSNNNNNNNKINVSDNNNSIVLLSSTTTTTSNNSQHRVQSTLDGQVSESHCTSSSIGEQNHNVATTTATGGRHVCPYCNLNCTKPSVLEKHIRAHTNERPYPCDICSIAFKTRSNYYKHCRSRSHAARKKGIEVPPDADDGLSDQEGDPELSNSGSEVISRTDSPLDEQSVPSPTMLPSQITNQQQQQYLQQQLTLAHTHSPTPTPSPSSLSATKTTYFQQQQPPQLPLGSPAAGTLPPTTTTATMPHNTSINNTAISQNKQHIEFKPYKPKFHNAALYATTKDGNTGKHQAMQLQQQQPISSSKPNSQVQQQQQQQQPQQTLAPAHLVPLQQQQPTMAHPVQQVSPQHASMKLSNHLSIHQLHQHQQQQPHIMASPPIVNQTVGGTGTVNAGTIALPTPTPGVYYLGQPPNAAVAALLHPGATHLPQQYYDPVAAAVAHQQAMATFHMLTPQQQQFHHQLQLQQHLQEQQLKLQLQHHQQQQHQQQHQQHQQQQPNPTSAAAVLKAHGPQLTATIQSQPITPATLSSGSQQRSSCSNTGSNNKSNATHYLTNGASSAVSMGNTSATSTSTSLLHSSITGVAAVASSGGVHLNKEFLQEHISKLISQNEAIVENKELLLQKKYPKTLNRSRSFNNNNNNTGNNTTTTASNNSNNNSNSNLVTTTTVNSESANAKLAQAIAHKKHMQMQQHHQQQQQQQQQQHQQQQQQQQQHMQYQQQQQHQQQLRLDESHSNVQQHYPINGISKHLNAPKQHTQQQSQAHLQQYRQQQTQSQLPQHVTQSLQLQAQNMLKEVTTMPLPLTTQQSCSNAPLNLSAKSKSTEQEPQQQIIQRMATSPATTQTTVSAAPPRTRQSLEQQVSNTSETSSISSTNSNSNINTANGSKHPPNNSIIKNLLLNARGLAVPTGEGDDAVYICPLCAMEFRTAEDLQLHNSTYCQGATNSAPITPVASPSLNPLSLAKLAWSRLRTKPSTLVLSRLSASQAQTNNVKTITSTTNATNSVVSSLAEASLRLIDTPLPSPGPLLGKTPLVDSYNNNETYRKPPDSDVIITKMHEDRQFSNDQVTGTSSGAKRARYESNSAEPFPLTAPPSGLLIAAAKQRNNLSGGEMQLLTTGGGENKKEERLKRFTSSGGCIVPISECSDVDKSPKLIRTPLLSGGSFQEVSPKKDKDGKTERITIATPKISGLTDVLGLSNNSGPQHFQFPPINSITAFNPLTLPPLQGMCTSGEKIIPYVPGIPGPNTPHTPQLPPPPQQLQLPQSAPRNVSPNRKKTASPMVLSANDHSAKSTEFKNLSPFGGVHHVPSEFNRVPPSPALRNVRNWSSNSNQSGTSLKPASNTGAPEHPKKSFNFQRIADNLSPRKNTSNVVLKSSPPEQERRHFNFDALGKEHELNIQPASPVRGNSVPASLPLVALHVDITNASNISETANSSDATDTKKTKFLRPTSLPLKPGTFTPKRHHGITPTANTLPLISPETPRPSKSCVQLYLNGHAYTYLGLKCSTKMFYCTVNCPQPSYVAGMHKLSMYSVWQVCAENNPHPMGLKPKEVMSLYDSRQKNVCFTMSETSKIPYRVVTSQQTVMTPFFDNSGHFYHHQLKPIPSDATVTSECGGSIKKENGENVTTKKDHNSIGSTVSVSATSSSQLLVGGYESHEDYTYIRGRGRGRYVCSECGIRCKKPSMLKKHIRTHTDVRPYTCKHCNFSFKTKGNLTKHMQSKTHYKKCIELGLNPGPMPADGEFLEPDMDCDQQSTTSAGGRTSSIPGESDSDDYSDNETESSDTDECKSRLQEHEAARCLLSLSMTPPIAQSVSPQLKTESMPAYQSQNFNIQPNATVFTSTSTTTLTTAASASTHPNTIKRVVSFTQPKPPFDYHKQEQYYSNPEESKPKRTANSAATGFESAPIDLTKPRASVSSSVISSTKEPMTSVSMPVMELANAISTPGPGPVQTKAQIRDVIFGSGNNESGFLKTVISVSDKVRISAECSENSKNINENVLLQNYLKEQALQYHKIKQSQMSRSSFPTMSVGAPVTTSTSPTTTATSSISASVNSVSVVTTLSTPVVISNNPSSVTMRTEMDNTKSDSPVQTVQQQKQKMDVITNPQDELNAKSAVSKVPSIKPHTNDECDDYESASEPEIGIISKSLSNIQTTPPPPPQTTQPSTNESYNANLPAAVHQPGITDFSGVLSTPARTIIVGEDGFKKSTTNEIQPVYPRSTPITADGRSVCTICSKSFQKQHQLTLHMNIHYMERKFKCEPCGVSFRTQGHFQKHERSDLHKNKVMMTSTFGVPTTSNPRPFECTDCKIAFRIHGHLAKHLRSKGHVQKLECLQKLPFGTYAEIERAGISLTEIDTSDCENSLISLKQLAQKLIEKDPSKLSSYTTPSGMDNNNSNTGIASQDSASEDGFSAAASAAASAIASLENDSPTDTPRRANSTSEDEGFVIGLKRRLPGSFSNGEDSDNPTDGLDTKRARSSEQAGNISSDTNNAAIKSTVSGGNGSVRAEPNSPTAN